MWRPGVQSEFIFFNMVGVRALEQEIFHSKAFVHRCIVKLEQITPPPSPNPERDRACPNIFAVANRSRLRIDRTLKGSRPPHFTSPHPISPTDFSNTLRDERIFTNVHKSLPCFIRHSVRRKFQNGTRTSQGLGVSEDSHGEVLYMGGPLSSQLEKLHIVPLDTIDGDC
ncbi:hypothetical protein C0J50_13797 [Silurus asotus]|uniref:Uncharacterized protein n=1 Tax=Silurus asotus TaxID=30991 RepID=A0AAD5B0K7_SILAS|nr:hypothetical protein C0J50_13797 [Silurus asotus]